MRSVLFSFSSSFFGLIFALLLNMTSRGKFVCAGCAAAVGRAQLFASTGAPANFSQTTIKKVQCKKAERERLEITFPQNFMHIYFFVLFFFLCVRLRARPIKEIGNILSGPIFIVLRHRMLVGLGGLNLHTVFTPKMRESFDMIIYDCLMSLVCSTTSFFYVDKLHIFDAV